MQLCLHLETVNLLKLLATRHKLEQSSMHKTASHVEDPDRLKLKQSPMYSTPPNSKVPALMQKRAPEQAGSGILHCTLSCPVGQLTRSIDESRIDDSYTTVDESPIKQTVSATSHTDADNTVPVLANCWLLGSGST